MAKPLLPLLGAIQVLVASKVSHRSFVTPNDLIIFHRIRLGVYPTASHTVIIIGVRFYEHRYIDYPIVGVLRMMGRACRPLYRTRTANAGRCVSKLVRTSVSSSCPRFCSSNRSCQRTYCAIISWPRLQRRLLKRSRMLRCVAFCFNFFPAFWKFIVGRTHLDILLQAKAWESELLQSSQYEPSNTFRNRSSQLLMTKLLIRNTLR